MKKLNCWIPGSEQSDFSIYNLPFGIFSTSGRDPRVGVAIGDQIIDLAALVDTRQLSLDPSVLQQAHLNAFIRLGKEETNAVRETVQGLLSDESSPLKGYPQVFIPQEAATMHLPVQIGDYTDFYSSIEHATNVGKMFRDPANALLPNWRHIPVGYHGRASSIIPSGVPIHRPKGQTLPKGADAPIFKASSRLDFELEMGFIIGKDTELGTSVTTQEAPDHIFGMVLFNDWSARDIQKWEYVPLGPFLGKNFASSISPWVVTMEALAPFQVQGPAQEPAVLPYLQYEGEQNYAIDLAVSIQPDGKEEQIICRSNFKYMYWNMAQQLAHHTSNGCNIAVGDMMASGTISGQEPSSYGSMLELSWSGSKPLILNDGSQRTFIEDNDTIIMRGKAEKEGIRVGFGEVRTKVLPSIQHSIQKS